LFLFKIKRATFALIYFELKILHVKTVFVNRVIFFATSVSRGRVFRGKIIFAGVPFDKAVMVCSRQVAGESDGSETNIIVADYPAAAGNF